MANENIDFRVERGQVHALLGENGAGKSTLVNVLFGLYHADEGEIRIAGEKVEMNSPHDAIDRHIGMVHQHFQLVPVLSVTENIVLGHEPTKKRGILDLEKAFDKVLRELVFGYPHNVGITKHDRLAYLTASIGLSAQSAEFIYAYLESKGPVFVQWGIDPKVIQIINSIANTWGKIESPI